MEDQTFLVETQVVDYLHRTIEGINRNRSRIYIFLIQLYGRRIYTIESDNGSNNILNNHRAGYG